MLTPCSALLAQLGFRPAPSWLAEWERCSGGRLEESSSGGLAAAAWALAEMGHRPQVGADRAGGQQGERGAAVWALIEIQTAGLPVSGFV